MSSKHRCYDALNELERVSRWTKEESLPVMLQEPQSVSQPEHDDE